MAKCPTCDQEMTTADSCLADQSVDYPDGEQLPPVPYETPDGVPPGHRCHDCGVKEGGIHHPGCDMERCPRCGGQLISCGCLDGGEEDEE